MTFAALFTNCVTDDNDGGYALGVGDPLPEFTVTMKDGSTVNSADLAGSVSVISFFHTSCPDCQEEFPILQEAYERSADTGVRFICIAREQEDPEIEEYWTANGLTLPYSPQPDRRIYSLFASSIIPRTYVVSPDLVITAAFSAENMPTVEDLMSECNRLSNY